MDALLSSLSSIAHSAKLLSIIHNYLPLQTRLIGGTYGVSTAWASIYRNSTRTKHFLSTTSHSIFQNFNWQNKVKNKAEIGLYRPVF